MLLFALFQSQPISGYEAVPHPMNRTKIEIINRLPAADVLVFHGMWCRDCRMEIPVLNRVLRRITTFNVTDVSLDYSKRDEAGLAEAYDVRSIPMVVVQDGARECRLFSDGQRWESKLLSCLMQFHSLDEEDAAEVLQHGFADAE